MEKPQQKAGAGGILDFDQAMFDFRRMFPSLDAEVIEAVLRANGGAVDDSIDQLLLMADGNNGTAEETLPKTVDDSNSSSPNQHYLQMPSDDGDDLLSFGVACASKNFEKPNSSRTFDDLPPSFQQRRCEKDSLGKSLDFSSFEKRSHFKETDDNLFLPAAETWTSHESTVESKNTNSQWASGSGELEQVKRRMVENEWQRQLALDPEQQQFLESERLALMLQHRELMGATGQEDALSRTSTSDKTRSGTTTERSRNTRQKNETTSSSRRSTGPILDRVIPVSGPPPTGSSSLKKSNSTAERERFQKWMEAQNRKGQPTASSNGISAPTRRSGTTAVPEDPPVFVGGHPGRPALPVAPPLDAVVNDLRNIELTGTRPEYFEQINNVGRSIERNVAVPEGPELYPDVADARNRFDDGYGNRAPQLEEEEGESWGRRREKNPLDQPALGDRLREIGRDSRQRLSLVARRLVKRQNTAPTTQHHERYEEEFCPTDFDGISRIDSDRNNREQRRRY